MDKNEVIKDLRTLIEFFEEESGGCCPMCLKYCLDMLENMKEEESRKARNKCEQKNSY